MHSITRPEIQKYLTESTLVCPGQVSRLDGFTRYCTWSVLFQTQSLADPFKCPLGMRPLALVNDMIRTHGLISKAVHCGRLEPMYLLE